MCCIYTVHCTWRVSVIIINIHVHVCPTHKLTETGESSSEGGSELREDQRRAWRMMDGQVLGGGKEG